MQGVGGLVGANSSSTIFYCHSLGTASAQWYAGGLVGSNQEGLVESCFASAVVTGESSLGGLVGNNRGTVRDCYATGTVSGDQIVGGLVGRNGSQNVWDEHPGTIDSSYAGAKVTGAEFTGGLVGYHEFGTITNCLWDIDASGQNTSPAGRGATTAEMQTARTFLEAGWDFVDETANGTDGLWWIVEGQDYPRLWWEAAEEL
jgi:The GLUG motif